ncbi:hypothetical protein L1987_52171 [Smallanthus sonchifolius]|uniref:Uncharacterized protein n=1 Tax=Smallanthus sonchifolius TaxID=185202 RepID=A0ACB9ESC2_9ASTR|nr:hypothetical protein L1987_52171 [Smallanthus sonchifolius]
MESKHEIMPRSHSTGHSVVENIERYTLRLPNGPHVVFPMESSEKMTFRSVSVGSTRGFDYVRYERSNPERPRDEGCRWGCELVSEPKAQPGNEYSKSEIEEYPIKVDGGQENYCIQTEFLARKKKRSIRETRQSGNRSHAPKYWRTRHEPKAQSGNDYSKSEIEEYPIKVDGGQENYCIQTEFLARKKKRSIRETRQSGNRSHAPKYWRTRHGT